MIILVLGKPNSGKSEFAEEIALKTGDPHLYYLATMKVYDKEGQERVQKHRQKREGKGFFTVEKEYGITDACKLIPDPANATVLLECISNLVGNELFENPKRSGLCTLGYERIDHAACERFADEVSDEIKDFAENVHHLILVSNSFETDGENYDDQTRLYVQMMELVNQRLLAFADRIYDLRKK